MLPPSDKLSICFAHVAYRLHERFPAFNTGISSFAVRDLAGLEKRVGEAHVLVISGLWQSSLLDRAKKLRFIQSIGAGTDQFPRDEPAKRGIRLASARGVNAQAVADHAIALILASSRRLPEARDNQAKRVWRGMIGDLAEREDELGGKTFLASVLAISADASPRSPRLSTCASSGCGAIRGPAEARRMRCTRWKSSSRSCPRPISLLSAVVDAEALSRMKPSAHLVNVARGRVVDEAALVDALAARRIAGVGIDVTAEEPLAPNSPLWGMAHVLITPHTAGETRRYEDNAIEILRDNLGRLWRGEQQLRNQVV